MSRTFYRMRTSLPSSGATGFLWCPARLPHAGVRVLATTRPGAPGDYTGLTTYSVISW